MKPHPLRRTVCSVKVGRGIETPRSLFSHKYRFHFYSILSKTLSKTSFFFRYLLLCFTVRTSHRPGMHSKSSLLSISHPLSLICLSPKRSLAIQIPFSLILSISLSISHYLFIPLSQTLNIHLSIGLYLFFSISSIPHSLYKHPSDSLSQFSLYILFSIYPSVNVFVMLDNQYILYVTKLSCLYPFTIFSN